MSTDLNYCEKHACNKIFYQQWSCIKCGEELIKRGRVEHTENLIKNLKAIKLKNAQIPLDLLKKDLNNFFLVNERSKEIVDLAINYVRQIVKKNNHWNLMIIGPTGVGKSHIAVGILKYYFEQKKSFSSIGYTSAFDLANKVIATWNNPDLNENSILNEYSEIDLLIIDDLGYADEGKKSEIINKVIYRRHEKQKSTIITSNLKGNQVLDYMGSRTRSRFLSRLSSIIEIESEDYRLMN